MGARLLQVAAPGESEKPLRVTVPGEPFIVYGAVVARGKRVEGRARVEAEKATRRDVEMCMS